MSMLDSGPESVDRMAEAFALAETIPALVWIAAPGGRVEYANRRWTEFTGLDIAGKSFEDVLEAVAEPDDVRRVVDRWLVTASSALSLPEAIAFEAELRLRRADGMPRWHLMKAVPVHDPDGGVRRWYGTSFDIDDRKRSESDASRIADALPHFVFRALADGSFEYFNNWWSVYSGLTPEESRGWGWVRAVHPEDVGSLLARWRGAVEAGDDFECQARIQRAYDRAFRWFMLRAHAVGTGPQRKWFGTCTDIDEQLRATNDLRFLVETGSILSRSLDYATTLRSAARLAVDTIADLCLLDVKDPQSGAIRLVAVHRDPVYEFMLRGAVAHLKSDPGYPMHYAVGVMTTAQPLLVPAVDDAFVDAHATSPTHAAFLRTMQYGSMIVVPVVGSASPHPLGALTIVATRKSGRRYGTDELSLAEELGRRAGAAIETAYLFSTLRQSRDELSTLAQTLPELVWAASPEGRIDFWNERWSEYAGMPFEGGALPLERIVHPQDLAGLSAAWERARANGGESLDREVRLCGADGAYRWFIFRGRTVRASDGRTLRWIGSAIDIDETKRDNARLSLIARVGYALASARGTPHAVQEVAELIAGSLADWCVVWIDNGDGPPAPRAIAHRDPERKRLIEELLRQYPLRGDDAVSAVAAGTIPAVLSDEWDLERGAQDERHAAGLRALDVRSMIVAPIALGEEQYGALQLAGGSDSVRFSPDDARTAKLLADRIAVTLDNLRIYERERRIARTFQEAALPRSLPQLEDAAIDAIYVAGDGEAEVGGDWYDAFPLPDGRLAFSVGDVTGKGVAAAVLMSSARQSIRLAALLEADPAGVLAIAGQALEQEHPGRFVSALYGVVDLRARRVRIASAGHPGPYVRFPDGTVMPIDDVASVPPLGVRSDFPPRTRELPRLPEGALLVLYTDGLLETTRDVLAGERMLLETLRHRALGEVRKPAHFLRDAILVSQALDDVAILTLRFGGRERWAFSAPDAAEAQGARSSLMEHLRAHARPDSDFGSAEVIAGELFGNVVRYAPGPIDVVLEWDDASPTLHVYDRGPAFDIAGQLPGDIMAENGRGLYLVTLLAKAWGLEPLPGRGNHIEAVLPVERATSAGVR